MVPVDRWINIDARGIRPERFHAEMICTTEPPHPSTCRSRSCNASTTSVPVRWSMNRASSLSVVGGCLELITC
jgi:hypothetical protein